MATNKPKNKRPMHRNRASPRTAVSVTAPAGGAAAKDAHGDPNDDTRGWRAIKAAGGALVTTIAGAYLARQDWVPPKAMAGAITALGAALAVGAPSKTVRSIGLGAMSAAGGQLGFMVIDDELMKSEAKKEQIAINRPAMPPAKKPANAGELPADALARAYERARLRMAMSADTPH